MITHRYDITQTNLNKDGKRTLSTIVPPKIEKKQTDIYIYTRVGDRLDLLANDYYGERTHWVYIAAANNLKDMVLKPGIQLRIPQDSDEIRREWINQNKSR